MKRGLLANISTRAASQRNGYHRSFSAMQQLVIDVAVAMLLVRVCARVSFARSEACDSIECKSAAAHVIPFCSPPAAVFVSPVSVCFQRVLGLASPCDRSARLRLSRSR